MFYKLFLTETIPELSKKKKKKDPLSEFSQFNRNFSSISEEL